MSDLRKRSESHSAGTKMADPYPTMRAGGIGRCGPPEGMKKPHQAYPMGLVSALRLLDAVEFLD